MGFYGTLKLIFYKVSIDQRPIDRGVGVSLVWMRLFHRGGFWSLLARRRMTRQRSASARTRTRADERQRAASLI